MVDDTIRARKTAFNLELNQAKALLATRDYDGAFAHLERAHILGQPTFLDHVITHIWMLKVAIARSDISEVRGQILRLLATIPGHLFGWLPVGNTGGANVSALKPMAIPADLEVHFVGFDLRQRMFRQITVLFGAVIGVIMLAIWIGKQN